MPIFYRICGDEQGRGIGSSSYPKIGERLDGVFATPCFKTAQHIVAVLNGMQLESGGGVSWALIFIVRADSAVPLPIAAGNRADCDHDQHIITGTVVGVLTNKGNWSY